VTKVAVVGLGAMGSRIAGRVIAAGNEVDQDYSAVLAEILERSR
jgi:3-hydroxyisobutyrate dehydrogenase-like beta-hydroxyacid dehydrogenase